MERFARWLSRRLIPRADNVREAEVRTRYGLLAGWISIVGNLVLGVAKLAVGVAVASTGLVADAVHSLSDTASSVVVIIGFRLSRKPPDKEHPFGHAKAEYIATLVVALLIVMAGFEIGQQSMGNLLAPPAAGAMYPLTWPLLLALLAMIAAKEVMARLSASLGRLIRSSALEADGWHHRTDALSTLVVIVGLGARNFGMPWMDGVAGLLVAAYIIYTGFSMAVDTFSPLLGEVASQEEIEEMRGIVNGVPGVVNAHEITVHRYGHFYFTTVHAEISDRMDVHAMHARTVLIETRILKRFPGQCVVHIDPVNLHHPLLHKVSEALKDVVLSHEQLVEFHDLNLWDENGRERGDVEVAVDPDLPETEYPALAEAVRRRIAQRFPQLELNVRCIVDFTASPLAEQPYTATS